MSLGSYCLNIDFVYFLSETNVNMFVLLIFISLPRNLVMRNKDIYRWKKKKCERCWIWTENVPLRRTIKDHACIKPLLIRYWCKLSF